MTPPEQRYARFPGGVLPRQPCSGSWPALLGPVRAPRGRAGLSMAAPRTVAGTAMAMDRVAPVTAIGALPSAARAPRLQVGAVAVDAGRELGVEQQVAGGVVLGEERQRAPADEQVAVGGRLRVALRGRGQRVGLVV